MTELAALGLSIRSDGIVVATDRLKDFEGAGRRAESVSGSLVRAATKVGAALAGAFSVRVLQQYADAWSDMQSRVGAAIKNMDAAPAMMQRIVDIANASYSPLKQTVEIFGRNVVVLQSLGRTATEAADFTEALNHALVTTATKGQDADVVLNALSRSIAIGGLRAMEFETIMSRSPRVLEAIAEEMGTNVTGLRALAQQGKITGQIITDALINSLEKLREEAGEMPATIGDAFTRIRTNTMALVGTLDQAWGISGRVAEQMLAMADGIRASVDTFLRLGNVVGTLVGPAMDVLSGNIETVASAAQIAVVAMAGFYAPAVLGGLASLTAAIGVGLVGAIRAVTLAMMANPLGLLIGGLAAAVTAAFMFRDEIKQAIGIDVVEVMIDVGNKTIGVFVGAYEAVKEQWSNLPTFFSAIGKMAWNNFLSSFEGPALTIDTPWGSWQSGGFDLSGAKSALTAAEQASFGQSSATFDQGFNRDYIKGLGDAVGDLWTNADGATGAINALMDSIGGGGGGGAGGTGSGSGKESSYAKLVRGAHEFIAAQTLERQALGMTAEAAARMHYEQDLLNKAANDNIALTPKMRGELMGLAAQMAAVEEATRRVTEIYNFGKDVFGGMFSDLKAGLREGQGLWEALGNTAANALDKIADKALSMAANGIWDWLFGAFMGALSGPTGGAWGNGLWGSAIFNAKGGVYASPSLSAYSNGIYDSPQVFAFARGAGVFGEAGPEAIMPLARTPGGDLGVRVANQNHGNDNARRGDVHITINGSGLSEEQLARAIARGLEGYDAALAPKVEAKFRQMQNDPRAADGGW